MSNHYMTTEEQQKWDQVLKQLQERFGIEPDLKAVLFLIGIRETGAGKKSYTKEQKEDFMNLAICKILSLSGYFSYKRTDEDGWPEWDQEKPFPRLELDEQESMLKSHVVKYFDEEAILE